MLNRRTFLHSLGAGAALPFAPAFAAQPSTSPRTMASEKPFVDLAIATICTDGFGNQGHEPAFRLLPQTGFRNVEFNLWYPNTLTPSYLATIASRCEATGLHPISLQGTGFGAEGRSGVIKDIGHKLSLMYGCLQLGCRRIKCTGAGRDTQGGLKAVIEVCRDLAPAAKELNVLVTLENHAKNVLENIADYEEIFAAIDSPYVGMCLDTGHFEGVGIDLHEVVEKFHSRILHVDLKDCRRRGAGHDTVPFGEGVTDFKAFLDHLLSKSYSGYLVVEQAWAEPKEPVVENLRKAREMFEPYLKPAAL
jgi:sugar phosphate isomerase/epimerase